jgi:hypothetical protein
VAQSVDTSSYLLTDQEHTNFEKIQKPPQNSRRQKDDMTQVSYWGPINIRRHRKNKIGRNGDMVSGICAPLLEIYFKYVTEENYAEPRW